MAALDARAPFGSLVAHVPKDDEILLPKKAKAPPVSARAGARPSQQMQKLMRATRGVGLALGGGVTLVGVMSVVGLVADSFLVRFVVALLVVVGLPALLADRVLKRLNATGAAAVLDIFAIVLLGSALLFVSADALSKRLLASEGDRYARSGSTTAARFVYFLAGLSPVFPADVAAAGSASATASAPPPSNSGPR